VFADIEISDLSARRRGHINPALRIDRAGDRIGHIKITGPLMQNDPLCFRRRCSARLGVGLRQGVRRTNAAEEKWKNRKTAEQHETDGSGQR
jgi:hypothetical protein